MNERMEFRVRAKKPRHELSLPQLTFHHADHWMKVLGLEVFSAWLMVYTWCDREKYPEDDISYHKNMKSVAESFGCKSVDKAQKIIKTLYEYGLIDIVQEKNKFGSMKNVYYWYDIPVYADSMFCELRKCRNWEDRNAHGQELVKLRKIKEKNNNLKSRSEKSYGSDETQENSGFHNEPYEKIERQPFEKIVHNNYINNNNVVVDKRLPVEKCRGNDVPESSPSGESDNHTKELQEQAEKACGVQLPAKLLGNLIKKYGHEKVKEKFQMLGSVQTKNAPGFLIAALRDDYVLRPGQPQQQNRASPGGRTRGKNARQVNNPDVLQKKEMIRALYQS